MKVEVKEMKKNIFLLVVLLIFVSINVFGEDVISIKSVNLDKMNSVITIKGKIINIISPNESNTNYALYIFDGTESMRLTIPADIFMAIKSKNKIEIGDTAKFTGKVKAYSTTLEMWVEKSSDIEIEGSFSVTKEEAKSDKSDSDLPSEVIKDLSKITRDSVDKKVFISGKVASFQKAWKDTAPNTITLSDGKNSVPVVFWADVDKNLSPDYKNIGTELSVLGTVNEFKDTLQIKVKKAEDMKIVSSGSPSTMPENVSAKPMEKSSLKPEKHDIKSIDVSKDEEEVIVEGKVEEYTASWNEKAPNKAKISDGTGSIIVVFWDDIKPKLPKVPEVGDVLNVTGKTQLYRNELQIKVKNPTDIKFIESSKSIEPKTEGSVKQKEIEKSSEKPKTSGEKFTPIKDISEANKDSVYSISGEIVNIRAPRNDRAPFNIEVKDDTGKIAVVYWKDVADKLKPGQIPTPGKKIQVKGTVGVHNKELQIKINAPSDMKISE